MSHMSPIHPTFARHVECACTTCTSLRDVRGGITSIPIQHMIAMYGEQEAANRIIEADHLLGEAQEVLRRKHVPGPYSSMSNNALTGRERSGASVSPPKSARDSAISIIRDATENRMSPVRSRQVTNGWQGAGTPPANTGKTASTFEDVVRSRAAELGILRTQQASVPAPVINVSPPQVPVNINDTKNTLKEKSQFIVCDHCRSHGIRCNEASVCRECILRQVPCTHRQCDLSPGSREGCPRQVCFYVHGDFMPDVWGAHNPECLNWIILPGKLRDHLSAGQLGKQNTKSEKQVIAAYAGVTQRQQEAVRAMASCVQTGLASWETVAMQCACMEIEHEEQRTRTAEDNLRHLGELRMLKPAELSLNGRPLTGNL